MSGRRGDKTRPITGFAGGGGFRPLYIDRDTLGAFQRSDGITRDHVRKKAKQDNFLHDLRIEIQQMTLEEMEDFEAHAPRGHAVFKRVLNGKKNDLYEIFYQRKAALEAAQKETSPCQQH